LIKSPTSDYHTLSLHDALPIYKDGTEHTLGQPCLLKDMLDFQRDPRDIGGVLEHGGVARHQGRGGKAEDLPVREVPGHDRQNNRSEEHTSELQSLAYLV